MALYPRSRVGLSERLAAVKIARHSPCELCECLGLHPAIDVVVATDDEQSIDDDDSTYLSLCACGHGTTEHGADSSQLGRVEFDRRSRAAFRLDEILYDLGKLLDFAYTDDDIASLRRQMKLPVSVSRVPPSVQSPGRTPSSPASSLLSDLPPPNKRRRISVSSLSGPDDDDEEEEPLAARMAHKSRPGHRGTKKGPVTGKKGPFSHELSGKGSPTKVKREDKLDESQITRLATGITVDTSRLSAGPPAKTEKAAAVELRRGVIVVTPVENDNRPRSRVILTNLKTLFQKQLPKMPREYITRLVYDSNSKCLAIIKYGYKVVGGICYRPFPHRGFAEIAFFATASVDQVKGYGAMLMDHFKSHIRNTYPDMMHFLTYADNYAVGYFEKQGFSKEITLDRSIWAGYIKDYEGGTIMQCTMLPKVDYLDKASIIAQQQNAILQKIRQMSKSQIVYPGLPQFQEGADPNFVVGYTDIPGLRDSGWTPDMAANAMAPRKSADHYFMERVLKEMIDHPQGWAFVHPVNKEDVADYYDVIKNPMDFTTMEHKVETNQYPTIEAFVADATLIFDNCRLYNQDGSIYTKNANKLERFLQDQLRNRVKRD